MGGEKFRQRENQQLPDEEDTKSLSDMPSFEQHMSSSNFERAYDESNQRLRDLLAEKRRSEDALIDAIDGDGQFSEMFRRFTPSNLRKPGNIVEKKSPTPEITERDRTIFGEIEKIEDPYDQNLVLSIVPNYYDKNGKRKQENNPYNFDALSLAIEYANRKNKSISIEEFARRKDFQLTKEYIENPRPEPFSSVTLIHDQIKMINALKDHLKNLEEASRYSGLQRRIDNDERAILEINDEEVSRYANYLVQSENGKNILAKY